MKIGHLILAACMILQSAYADNIRVLLASKSRLKQEAVREVFSESFPDSKIEVVSYPAVSFVPEQPIGKPMGIKGAKNRLEQLIDSCADYEVSIENYIFKDKSWKDQAVMIIKQKEKETTVFTRETEIPDEYVELAKNQNATVGEVLHEAYPCLNPSDWQAHFGGISRKECIKEALFKVIHSDAIQVLKEKIALYPDFPKKGILFQDFAPILRDDKSFKLCIDLLAKRYSNKEIDSIIGLESRGFILGSALAYKLGVPFIPVRKAGKIPGDVYTVDYEKEYGTDSFSLSQEAVQKGQRVLIVDDLIATGGSAKAAVDLVRLAEGEPVEFVSLLEIKELEGRKKLGIPTFNLID